MASSLLYPSGRTELTPFRNRVYSVRERNQLFIYFENLLKAFTLSSFPSWYCLHLYINMYARVHIYIYS